MKVLVLAFSILALSLSAAQAVTAVVWEDLKDPKAASFEDPFAELSSQNLHALGTVLRLRTRLENGEVTPEDWPRVTERLSNEEAKLAASGVQTDRLLAQRKEIGRKRAKAALAGNPALKGESISITGYVIPVADENGAVTSGYLVPEYGMCSHMPAPDPNQMIRYQGMTDWEPQEVYQPVLLTGQLDLAVTRQTIMLLDGDVEMIAAFQMNVSDIQPLDPAGPSVKDRIFRFFKGDPGNK